MEEITEKKKVTKLIPIKVISILLLVLFTAFMAWMLIDISADKDQTGQAIGLVVYIMFILVPAAIGYGAIMLFSLSGLIAIIVSYKKGKTTKGQITWFAVLTAAPAVVWLCLLGLIYLV